MFLKIILWLRNFLKVRFNLFYFFLKINCTSRINLSLFFLRRHPYIPQSEIHILNIRFRGVIGEKIYVFYKASFNYNILTMLCSMVTYAIIFFVVLQFREDVTLGHAFHGNILLFYFWSTPR